MTNLEVMMIVKSLKSRGYLTDVFNWQWSYYVVTKEGVKYLIQQLGKFRRFLHLLNDFFTQALALTLFPQPTSKNVQRPQ